MPKIKSGIVRFKQEVHAQKRDLFEKLSKGQHPEALFITCSDSRIDPNLLVQTEPGELFIIRNAGNIVPPHSNQTGGVTASIEYAVAVLNVKHIIICGHSGCGAMAGVMNPESIESLPHVSQWLSFASAAKQIVLSRYPEESDEFILDRLVEENVLMQRQHIATHPHVAARMATGKIEVHAWCYDIGSGDVRAYDDNKKGFVPVDELYHAEAREFVEANQEPCSH
jgi:carbonic anhydrase